MGISDIMQPRDQSQPRVPRPPSSDPAPDAATGVSRDQSLVPAELPTHELPSKANRKYARKPKPIRDPKLRKVIGLILALRVMGKTRAEIAEELQMPESTVTTYLWRARKKGYLDSSSFDNPNDVIDTIIRPKCVENVEALLDWRHPKTGLPSMDMTIETAKGIGVFQQHSVNKGQQTVNANANVLRVQIVMPTHGAVEAREGSMGGQQNLAEGEVVEEEV